MAPLIAVNFSDDSSPPEKLTLSQDFNLRNVLYYSPTTRYCAHYEDIICIRYTSESCLLKSTNQKKEKSISDLVVMARPERVAFSLSLASSSSELMNARITSIEPSSPQSQFALVTRRSYYPGGPKKLCFITRSLIPMVSIARLSVVKQSSFGLPGQYGRRVTRVNGITVILIIVTFIRFTAVTARPTS